MYEYIKGKLIEVDSQKAIIDVNGIGYKVFIPSSLMQEIVSKEEVLLYTTFVVKEDSQTLYGFLTKLHRSIFQLLTTVSGVGAKTAILLLGHLDIENLHLAIANADTRLISKVPGIGKKTAERLIVELRDKFKILDTSSSYESSKIGKPRSTADAINALINLGYSPIQAQKAVKTALNDFDKEPELSILITKALQKI
ncbi:MAG: Holliday junction branch migration protein RuvA [Parachlamydiales bacterium]|nr:Holliday junction branch migration protein RuvA [Parachlamydiales bacterium]